jgi:hypothetical protein
MCFADGRRNDRILYSPKLLVREPGKIVQTVLPAEVEDITRLNEIAEGLQEPLQAAIRRRDRVCGLCLVLD